MVTSRNAFLIDSSFIVERTHKAFLGTSLLTHEGKDATFTFGFIRDFLRLRQTLGIGEGALVLGREAQSRTSAQNATDLVTFLREARIPFLYDPLARTSDMIGALRPGFSHIVTADALLLQFLLRGFVVVLVADDDERPYRWLTRETLVSEIGVPPEKVLLYLTLTRGLGPSGLTKQQATRLLELYPDLDSICAAVPKITSPRIRKLLATGEAQARRFLAENALRAAPQRALCRVGKGLSSLASNRNHRLLAHYGFYSLQRLLEKPKVVAAHTGEGGLASTSYAAVVDQRGLESLRAAIKSAKLCAIDTETDGKDPRTATLLGVAFSVTPGNATFVPLVEGDMADMSRDAVLEWLQTIFDDDVPFVGHNIKFDYLLLRRNGVKMKVVHFDTMLAAFECHGDWDFYNLAYVSQRLLGKKIKSYGDVVGENRTFLDLPLKVMVNHAGQDADMALRLYPVLLAQLKERGIAAQYFEETVPLIAQLAELELHGLRVKEHGIDRVRSCLAKRAAHLRAMICDRLGGDCDLDSLKDVTEKLEAALGRETVGRPRRLTISALEGLARSEPIVQLIVRYRRLRRQIAEVESISMAVRDKRVHPLFNQIRSPVGIVATDAPCLLVLGEFPSLAACFEADVNQFCVGKQRALDVLARASGDRRLRMDLAAKPKSVRHIASRPLIRELDQQELLLSCAIGYSDAAMTRRFLVDTAAVSETRCDLRRRYPVLFDWLDAYRREAEKTGYGSFEGKRKYIDGLRSSNIGKRAKALENVVRWLVRF